MPVAAQRRTGQMSGGSILFDNGHISPYIQGTIRCRLDGGQLRYALLWAAFQALKAQGAGRAARHDFGDLIDRSGIHLDPEPVVHIKDSWQPTQAARSVDAQAGFPIDGDLVCVIFTLDAGLLALLDWGFSIAHRGSPLLIIHAVLDFQSFRQTELGKQGLPTTSEV
jgi:hypothetical protein